MTLSVPINKSMINPIVIAMDKTKLLSSLKLVKKLPPLHKPLKLLKMSVNVLVKLISVILVAPYSLDLLKLEIDLDVLLTVTVVLLLPT